MSDFFEAVGDVFEGVGDLISGAFEAVGDVLEGIGGVITDAVKFVGQTVTAILEDPLPTLLQIGGSMIGIPPYVTSAAITAARGGDLGDIAKSAAISYASTEFMSSTQIGADIKNYTVNQFAGDFTDTMMENFNLTPDQAVQVSRVATASLNSSLVGGINAALSGRSVMDGIASGFKSGLVYSSTDSYFDSLNKDPNWGFTPQSLNLMKGAASTALNTIVSGKGDPAQAVGNYIAYAAINLGTSKVLQAAKDTYKVFMTDTEEAEKAQDKYTTAKAEYDTKVKDGEVLRNEINESAVDFKNIIDSQFTPFKVSYDEVVDRRESAIKEFNTQKNLYDYNKSVYDNYEYSAVPITRTFTGYNHETGNTDEYTVIDGYEWRPPQESFLTAANAAARAANAAVEKANIATVDAQKLLENNKPMLDALESKKAEIETKQKQFDVIKADIEAPNADGTNTAAKVKAAADEYQSKYEAWSKTKEAADRSAENYTKALAEVASRDALIDTLNSGALKVTSKDADGNWELSNGMTLTTQGKFIQDGVQVFTNAAGIPQKVMDFKAADGSNVDFNEAAGRVLSETDVKTIFERDFGFVPTDNEVAKLAGADYSDTGNEDINKFVDQIIKEFENATGISSINNLRDAVNDDKNLTTDDKNYILSALQGDLTAQAVLSSPKVSDVGNAISGRLGSPFAANDPRMSNILAKSPSLLPKISEYTNTYGFGTPAQDVGYLQMLREAMKGSDKESQAIFQSEIDKIIKRSPSLAPQTPATSDAGAGRGVVNPPNVQPDTTPVAPPVVTAKPEDYSDTTEEVQPWQNLSPQNPKDDLGASEEIQFPQNVIPDVLNPVGPANPFEKVEAPVEVTPPAVTPPAVTPFEINPSAIPPIEATSPVVTPPVVIPPVVTPPVAPPTEATSPVVTPPVQTPLVVTPPAVTSPAVTPPAVIPPTVTPPEVAPPTVTPPVVTPPVVAPPVVTPPTVTPPMVTPPAAPPITIDEITLAINKAIADAKAAGLSGDQAAAKAISDVAASVGTTKEALLAQMGVSEASLRSDLASGLAGVSQNVANVEARINAAIAANEAAGMSRNQALTKAIDDVAASAGQTKADLLAQLGQAESGLRQEIAASQSQTQNQIANLSAQAQAQYAAMTAAQQAEVQARVTQGQTLQNAITASQQEMQQQSLTQYNALSAAQKAEADARIAQGQTLQQAIAAAQQETAGQIAGLTAQTQAQYAAMTAAQQAEVQARVAQGETLQNAITASQQATQQQAQAQYNALSAAQKAEADARIAQGQTLQEAIAASQQATASQISALSQQTQQQYAALTAAQKAEVDLRVQQGVNLQTAIADSAKATTEQIGNLKTDLTKNITDVQTQFNARVDELLLEGKTYQEATNSALKELGTGVTGLQTGFDEYKKQQEAAAKEAALQAKRATSTSSTARNLAGALSMIAPAAGAAALVDTSTPGFKDIGYKNIGEAKFESVLSPFEKMVEENFYAGKPQQQNDQQNQQPFQQAAPVNQQLDPQRDQQSSDYFNYGTSSEIDQMLGSDPGTQMLYSKAGGLATPLFAGGGTTRHGKYAGGGLNVVQHSGKARLDFRKGDAVTGPGDGQSDDIPAMLADGEFVFPADVVAALGNGSTKAGSDKLYDMMHSIRAYHRSAKPKDLPPPAKKSPLDYLTKTARKARR